MEFKDLKINEWFFCEDTYKGGLEDIPLLRKVDEEYALNTYTSTRFRVSPDETVRKILFKLFGKNGCTLGC